MAVPTLQRSDSVENVQSVGVQEVDTQNMRASAKKTAASERFVVVEKHFTAFGEIASRSLCARAHYALAQGVFISGESCEIASRTCTFRPNTRAAYPLLSLLVAPLGMVVAIVELIAGSIISLISLPFACTPLGCYGLTIGATTIFSGAVMLVAYPSLCVYAHTIGWGCCCGIGFDELMYTETT